MKFNATLNGLTLNKVMRQAPFLTISQKHKSNLLFNSLSISKSASSFLKSFSPVGAEFHRASFTRFLDSTIDLNGAGTTYTVTGCDFTGVKMSITEPSSSYTIKTGTFNRVEPNGTSILSSSTTTTLILDACTFTSSLASAAAYGCVSVQNFESLTLTSCTFTDCLRTAASLTDRARAQCLYCSAGTGTVSISGTTFTRQTDTAADSVKLPAIYTTSCATVTLTGTAPQNKFERCGGISVNSATTLTVEHTTFDTVETDIDGGSINFVNTGSPNGHTLKLSNVQITKSSTGTTGNHKGTAIYAKETSFSFLDTTIAGTSIVDTLIYVENTVANVAKGYFNNLIFNCNAAELVADQFKNGAALMYWANTAYDTTQTPKRGTITHNCYIKALEEDENGEIIIPPNRYRFVPQMTSDQCDEVYNSTLAPVSKHGLHGNNQILERPKVQLMNAEEDSKSFYQWVFGM